MCTKYGPCAGYLSQGTGAQQSKAFHSQAKTSHLNAFTFTISKLHPSHSPDWQPHGGAHLDVVLPCPVLLQKTQRLILPVFSWGFRGLSHISAHHLPQLQFLLTTTSQMKATQTLLSVYFFHVPSTMTIYLYFYLLFSPVSLLSEAHASSSLFACTYKNDCYNLNYS